MPESWNKEELTSTVPIFLSLTTCSAIYGALFDLSPWFGGVFLLCAIQIIDAIGRICTPKEVEVKALEVTLMGALIPTLVTLSGLSIKYFPIATNAINLSLASIVLPHLVLLFRTREKLNHSFVILTSSFQLTFNLFAAGVSYKLGTVVVLLNIAITCYALVALCLALYMIRDKVPIPALRVLSALLFAVSVVLSILGYFWNVNLMIGSIAAAITTFILFAFIDTTYHLMRFVDRSSSLPCSYVTLKCLSLTVVLGWGAVCVAGDAAVASSTKDPEAVYFFMLLLLLALHFGHECLWWDAKLDETKQRVESRNCFSSTILSILGIVVVLVGKASIVAWYIISYPSIVPDPLVLAAFAALMLCMFALLDGYTELLAKYSWTLSIATLVGAVYMLVYGCTLDGNFSPTPPGNGTVLSANYQERNLTQMENSFDNQEVNPTKRATFILFFICLAIIEHIFGAMYYERSRKKISSSTTTAAGRAPARAVAARAAAAPLAAPVQQDADSDYDNDNEEERPIV